jgi:predicted anti-sigma-YlaC factor YlaD|uniref:Putative zinc-finger domain-containing protein n=1 Tax=Mesoaciditoga lauensis TaxID=1495039 RepID=A0A7V3VSA7_9BACT
MKCEEFREKFIHEELNELERVEFEEHLKKCESCRFFVNNYKKVKDSLKLLYTFKPSDELEENILYGIKKRIMLKKALIFGVPGIAAVAMSAFLAFYIVTPAGKQDFAYDKAVSAGISLLNSQPGTTLTYAKTTKSNLDYLLNIKYVSDQF